MEQARLLVGDDERDVLATLSEILTAGGHRVDTATDGEQMLERVRSCGYDMVLCDLEFPPTDGVALLHEIKRLQPKTLVVIVTGYADVQRVMAAFRGGAFDVIEKPVAADRLLELAGRAMEVRGLGRRREILAEALENERLKVIELRQQLAADDPFESMIGSSPVMQRLVDTLREVARTECTLLLTGESGTGKGLVARTLHRASSRSSGPFVEANCVVYAEGVLHSELFGHERGAFTGAARSKKGRFELARGGTLFLDEIGEISPATQLLLLRVLQDRTFERVGGEETLEADVRLIAATNRDLPQAVSQGNFRSDLFYRLNVIPVQMPALRERHEDIPLLVGHFVQRIAARAARGIEGFTDEAMGALCRYPWPGNVRELENMVERIVALNRDKTVDLRDLPPVVQESACGREASDLPGTLYELERRRIIEVLQESFGNKKLAAQRLGIHRSTLYAKMRRHGMLGSSSDDTAARSDARQAEPEIATPVRTS